MGTIIKVRTKLKTVRIRHVDLKKGVQLDYQPLIDLIVSLARNCKHASQNIFLIHLECAENTIIQNL